MNKYQHLAPPATRQPSLVNMHAGKKRLHTLEYALQVREIMEQKYQKPFDAYHCPICNGYHVGHRFRPAQP